MDSIGIRIRTERTRLGMNQDDFAALAGVQRRAQGSYERDQRVPDAAYLAAVAQHGVDVMFVITGNRAEDVDAQLKAYGDAWEALDRALQENSRNMPADKKRQAAEALYQAVKAGDGQAQPLAELLIKAA